MDDVVETLALARAFVAQEVEFGSGDIVRAPAAFEQAEGVENPLNILGNEVCDCQLCELAQSQNTVVFGSGNPQADIMFVGEAPGAEEDRQGVPFVGASGQLLTRMIEAIGLTRDEVYIANAIKCRPPNNRDPNPEEIASCEPYLIRQIELIKPQVICTLGRFAAQTLLKTAESIGRLRGKVFDYHGVKLISTYHPAALLRNAQWKRPAWEDLKLVRKLYDGTEM
ncbi:MAG: uracil-DNA glycosylase [Candidatus Latescibacteria bacterium]|nr:uracil-DNA glycosylase [Candidatus Latescibacterota bacterium]